ncbi:MAG TPA: hypothetical protein VI199_06670 [Novosphingobium sp.]
MDQPVTDWMEPWQPLVDAVGREFDAGAEPVWGERIDPAMVARYLEPLEYDCRDGDGAPAIPDTALFTLSVPLLWHPGQPPIFLSDQRDAVPAGASVGGRLCGLEPPTTAVLAVQWDTDFLMSARIGDRLGRRGLLLVACRPKQTRLGRGAFLTWQTEIINAQCEVLARIRSTLYRYVPAAAAVPERSRQSDV